MCVWKTCLKFWRGREISEASGTDHRSDRRFEEPARADADSQSHHKCCPCNLKSAATLAFSTNISGNCQYYA